MKKTIGLFVGLFLVSYLLLITAVPLLGLDKAYTQFFKGLTATNINTTFAGKGILQVKNVSDKKDRDLKVIYVSQARIDEAKANSQVGQNKGNFEPVIYEMNSWGFGYMPTAFLLALIIATPIGWKRKLIALLVGFILITLFVQFKLWITLASSFEIYEWINTTTAESLFLGFLAGVIRFIGEHPLLSMSVATIIWVLVCFNKQDLNRLSQYMNQLLQQG